jgi:CHAT domain-containing protein
VVQVSTRERTATVRTGIGAGHDEFTVVTREFSNLYKGDEALGRLYPMHRRLLGSLAPFLEGISHCYVVPHNWLWWWEFNVLLNLDYAAGRDDFPRLGVAYLPSAAFLPHLKRVSLDGRALTLANPERGSERTLPFSEWEADRVRRNLESTQHDVWVGPAATVARAASWGEASIAHFCCHGGGDPVFAPLSHLVLADDVLLAHDVTHRVPPTSTGTLVLLSGCQTGMRDWRLPDQNMGLMGSFLLRGAGLVLSSPRNVDDLCSALMVSSFVEALAREGKRPTEALHAAIDRVRRLTADDAEAICLEAMAGFPEADFPHESAKLNVMAGQVCRWGGRPDGARHYAQRAAASLRRVGLDRQAVEVEDFLQAELPGSLCAERPFDSPMYWSSYQLLGRAD